MALENDARILTRIGRQAGLLVAPGNTAVVEAAYLLSDPSDLHRISVAQGADIAPDPEVL